MLPVPCSFCSEGFRNEGLAYRNSGVVLSPILKPEKLFKKSTSFTCGYTQNHNSKDKYIIKSSIIRLGKNLFKIYLMY